MPVIVFYLEKMGDISSIKLLYIINSIWLGNGLHQLRILYFALISQNLNLLIIL